MENPVHRAAVNTVMVHHLPAERLVGFQAGCFPCRADARNTGRFKRIDNPRLERGFGTDKGIVCSGFLCKADYGFNIGLPAEMDFFCQMCDSGVLPGHNGIDLSLCRPAEGRSYRMLASSPAHNEYLHHLSYWTYA